MTPDECRLEQVTIDEMDAATDESNLSHTALLMQVTSSKALWEIAAQLAELNQHLVFAFRAYSPTVIATTAADMLKDAARTARSKS